MRCDRLSTKLCDVSLDGSQLDGSALAHVEQCLRCQAEMARSRKLSRSLHALHDDVIVPDPGLLPAILETIEALPSTGNDSSRVRMVVAIGGIAAATAAGAAAGAVVLATRSRRLSA